MTDFNCSIQAYIKSNNNVICDVCGKKKKRSECTLAFGSGDIAVIISCLEGCADYRHPLNSPPPLIFDGQPVPDARPEGRDVFINSGITPSLGLSWGRLGGVWSKFNNSNSPFSFSPLWTWGNFQREQ